MDCKSVGTDLFRTRAGDTPREKAQRLKIEPTFSAPQYALPAVIPGRIVLAIFGLVVNDSLCQWSVDFRVIWEER
jgi:hypothetical protein